MVKSLVIMRRFKTGIAISSVAVLAWAFIMAPGSSLAVDYYVDQSHASASDSNPGTEAAPWETLLQAMTTATAGDTVFVKSGTYSGSNTTLSPGISGSPRILAIQPSNAGSSNNNRLVFRVFEGDQVTLDVSISGSGGNDYITWSGFTLTPGNFIRINGASLDRVVGTIIENCIVQRGGIPAPGGGNYDGIRLEFTSFTVVRNCILRNVYYTNDGFYNAAAIKMYSNDNALVENNEIYNNNAGIFDKDGGEYNVYRNNDIHDNIHTGIKFTGGDTPATHDIEIYQNIISNVANGIVISSMQDTHPYSNFRVYNNTIYNPLTGILSGPTPDLQMWNNIVYATDTAMILRDITSNLTRSNYSDFYPSIRFITDQYLTGEMTYTTLALWQATGFDPNSISQDPLFVNAAGGDFHLQSGSLARGAGRVGGVSSGAPVDMGAYPTGTEQIGIDYDRDTIAPAAPSGLSVE